MAAVSESGLTQLLDRLKEYSGSTVRLMEVCGTHTQAFFASGLRHALAELGVELISGPGCPVCVTAQADIDLAQEMALQPGVRVATFGDMLRVPGSRGTLAEARAQGAQIAVVYSPLDAVELARSQPQQQVVFLGIGFETTAPTVAAAAQTALQAGVNNFSIYSLHKTIPQAMQLIAADPRLNIDGFICPGHVSVITGTRIYEDVADASSKPCVVTGFTPPELAVGVLELLRRVRTGEGGVCNAYPRAVSRDGNPQAQALLETVFAPGDAVWRGLGSIPGSGLELRGPFKQLDACQRMAMQPDYFGEQDLAGCRCGEVLLGLINPGQCPLFAQTCTPLTPTGPCMVSKEGACQAYFKHRERGTA